LKTLGPGVPVFFLAYMWSGNIVDLHYSDYFRPLPNNYHTFTWFLLHGQFTHNERKTYQL